MKDRPYNIYFAGELFSLKHLAGNALLAESICRLSSSRFQCVLPQTLEQRETSPESIRNQDLRSLLQCDLGLFHFDGDEIDSGTVVEFMFAKFLDIPAVIIRTDFRRGGDGGSEPWNLMANFYPRTEIIVFDSMAVYQRHLKAGEQARPGSGESRDEAAVLAAKQASDEVAQAVIDAFERVRKQKPVLPEPLRKTVYEWARLMPGRSFAECVPAPLLSEIIEAKLAQGLL